MKLNKVLELMISGREFKFSGYTYYYKNYSFMWTNGTGVGSFNNFCQVEDWELIPKWYDKITKEGILCVVKNHKEDIPVTRLIRAHTNKDFYDDVGASYKIAEPLEFNPNNYVENF